MKFTNTYQQYKTDTNDFCQFLVHLSDYPVDTPPSPPKTGFGRLKGRARKLGKSMPTGVKPDLTPRKVTFTVGKLVEMAQKISIDPLKIVKVSRSILAKLERCITLRQLYLDLFEKKSLEGSGTEAIEDLERENRQHAHFVRILKDVLSILKPKCAPCEANRKVARQDEPSLNDSSSGLHALNSFHLLDIDDGESENELEIQTSVTVPKHPPNHQSAASSTKSSGVCCTDDQETLKEYYFASFCLFSDLHRLLRNALQHWALYKTGEIDLETATLINNTSIAAMRQAEKEFVEAFQDRFSTTPGYWDIALGLYNGLACKRGIDTHTFSGREDFPESAEHEDFYKVEMKDISELMCLRAAHLLTPAARQLKVTAMSSKLLHESFFRDANNGTPNHILSVPVLPPNSSLAPFSRFVFNLLQLRDSKAYLLDEFTYGIHELYSTDQGPIAVWLVFATTLFLDTNSILGDDISRPSDELQSAAHHAHSTLSRLNANSLRGLSLCKEPQFKGDYLGMIHEYIYILQDDMLQNPLRTVSGRETMPDTIDHHPAFCGTLLLWLRLRMHKLGSNAGKVDRCFLHATHAYNTFREIGGLDVRWPEIETFIAYHTPEKLFTGRTPKMMEECLKSFHLSMGLSTIMVRGQPSRVRKLGGDLYLKDRLKDSNVISILQDWAWTDTTQHSGYQATDKLLAQLVALKINQVPAKRTRHMDLVAQVLAVKGLAECEIPYLRVDLWGLYLQSMDIFRKIHSELDSYLKRVMGNDYNKRHEENPQHILHHILKYSVFERQQSIEILQPQLPYLSSHCIKVGSQTMKKILQSPSPSVGGNLLLLTNSDAVAP